MVVGQVGDNEHNSPIFCKVRYFFAKMLHYIAQLFLFRKKSCKWGA